MSVLGPADILSKLLPATTWGKQENCAELADQAGLWRLLLGVGYNKHGDVARGWDFGVGVQLKTPLEPYVRATYRWNRTIGDAWFWRVHPRVFWQNQRGFGASLTNILDHAFNQNWLFRSWTILQGEDEIEGLG